MREATLLGILESLVWNVATRHWMRLSLASSHLTANESSLDRGVELLDMRPEWR